VQRRSQVRRAPHFGNGIDQKGNTMTAVKVRWLKGSVEEMTPTAPFADRSMSASTPPRSRWITRVQFVRPTDLAAFLLLAAASAGAQPTTVYIPGRSWVLTFDIGLVTQYQARGSGQQFQYAASTSGVADAPRTNLSFFLEAQASDSKQACYTAFWMKAAANPLIDRDSVKHASYEAYEQVLYRLQSGQQQANFYFVKDGLCADVHVSLSKPMPLSEEAMTGFGKMLKW
jgi:hypothetical protein